MYKGFQEPETIIAENTITLTSGLLERDVLCTLFWPEGNDAGERLNLLLLNDGQEAENLRLRETLEDLTSRNCIKPVLVVAIHAGERLQEYGTAGIPDFKKRGSRAAIYTQFIKSELIPAIQEFTDTVNFESIAFAGFSLGGLSAFDIAWNNSDLFDKIGVFSGSFWWRSKDISKGYHDNDRIMHSIIKDTKGKPELKFWLQTGTKDETSDRNKNAIIDSIDDTVDLIKALEQKGYKRPHDIKYLELVGGSHDTATWGSAMPKFLCWAFVR